MEQDTAGCSIYIQIYCSRRNRLIFTDIFATDKRYGIVYADPPWRYDNRGCRGACEKHYPTMSLGDICNLPVEDIITGNSILFLWVTYPMLLEGLRVIRAWGFEYKTLAFQWLKTYPKQTDKFVLGLGYWTRSNSECCLLGTHGKPKRKQANISRLIIAPLGKHSEKPLAVREKIKLLMGEDIPAIELFARSETEGWDCWGNEAGRIGGSYS